MNETLSKEPTAKIILFIQYRRLTSLVSHALREFGIEHANCDGSVFNRAKAIREFKTSDRIRLILLSSEDSVSGLHLIEATHIVIMHPFLNYYDYDDSAAIAYEKQGIARAWRSGQTKELRLVRFLVRDTIEEETAIRRGYREGICEKI